MGKLTDELREKYLHSAVQAVTIYDRIDELIAELELIEDHMDKKQFIKTIKEFRVRVLSLRKNFETSNNFLFTTVDSILAEVTLILLSITTYKEVLREKGLTEVDERSALAATRLHINAISKQKRIRDRKKNLLDLKTDREGRVQRSRTLRGKEE